MCLTSARVDVSALDAFAGRLADALVTFGHWQPATDTIPEAKERLLTHFQLQPKHADLNAGCRPQTLAYLLINYCDSRFSMVDVADYYRAICGADCIEEQCVTPNGVVFWRVYCPRNEWNTGIDICVDISRARCQSSPVPSRLAPKALWYSCGNVQ